MAIIALYRYDNGNIEIENQLLINDLLIQGMETPNSAKQSALDARVIVEEVSNMQGHENYPVTTLPKTNYLRESL